MKENDELIDEIREVRRQISEKVGHDPQKLIEHYMEMQKKYAERLVKEELQPVEAVKI